MSAFIIQISKALGHSDTFRCGRAALVVLTFLLTMGANCGQAPAELCLNGSDCDDAWLTYNATFPELGETDVSDEVEVVVTLNRAFERLNSTFIRWSSQNGAILFQVEEAQDRRSITLKPTELLSPNTTFTVTILAGAAIASDGASSPELSFSFTTGLPSLGVTLESTLEGAWPAALLAFDEDVELTELQAATTWLSDGESTAVIVGEFVETITPVPSEEDEGVEEGEPSLAVSKRRFWVLPASGPRGGAQQVQLDAALLSSAGDFRLNTHQIFDISAEAGSVLNAQWSPPNPSLLRAADLEDAMWTVELDALPDGTSWLLLEVTESGGADVSTSVSALVDRSARSLSVSSAPWEGKQGQLTLRWSLTDGVGNAEVTEVITDYDFIAPATPTFSEAYPAQWAYDGLTFSLEVAEAGTIQVYVGSELTQSIAVETGLNRIEVVLPREFQVYEVGFSLVKASGNASELLVAQVERVPYPCLGTLVDGTLPQALSGVSELGALVIQDDGEGNVEASIPLNIGLVDDATLHSALPTRSFGGETELLIRPSPEMVTLIRFDPELIPACARVQRVTLVLTSRQTCTACPQPTIWDIVPVLVLWRENVVTWTNASEDTMWSSPGTGVDDVGNELVAGEWVDGEFRYEMSSAELESLLSGAWQGLRLSNFDVNVSFYSSESAQSDLRPKLELSVEEVRE